MTEAGLLANKKKLSNVEVQSTLQSILGSKAKAEEAMKSMQLAIAIDGEEAQTVSLTRKKIAQAVANGVLTKSEAELLGITLGVSAAQKVQSATTMPTWIANMKLMTIATLKQVAATIAWMATNPVGWIMGAVAAIGIFVGLINYQSKAAERATEKISELREEYSNSVSELN